MTDHTTQTLVPEMFESYYLDYAKYVIKDRAIPHIDDGLKPVQRRILYSLAQMHDGRYNKVAHIIGHCMRYHPHGDVSIGDALVHLGQKGLLIDTQGNWGHPITGDRAAAPRYIEARLTEFAREVIFNTLHHKSLITYQLSYDARFKEPVTLPSKFPLLLFQGAEGIAVGVATKIYPHNFCEILTSCIAAIKGRPVTLYPDFPTGGSADVSEYSDGKRGGKVKVRAKIHSPSPTQLVITEIPYETTTQSLIHSILQAEQKGYIQLQKIEDNSTDQVLIVIHLKHPLENDQSRQQMIHALYAFTKCQITLSANSCVIDGHHPDFLGVSQIIQRHAHRTKQLLTQERVYERDELTERIFALTLEHIFITQKIYPVIERQTSTAGIIKAIKTKLERYHDQLSRKPQKDDIIRLTEIKIRRISLFDSQAVEQKIRKAQKRVRAISKQLERMDSLTIDYFQNLIDKYGSDYPRRTTLTTFDKISKHQVSHSKIMVGFDKKQGLVGTAIKNASYVLECSSFDQLATITETGRLQVFTPRDKTFVGEKILLNQIYCKSAKDEFDLIYRKGPTGPYYIKKFALTSISPSRPYHLISDTPSSKIVYLKPSHSQNSPLHISITHHKHGAKPRNPTLTVDLNAVPLRSKTAQGRILTKYRITKIHSSAKRSR